MNNKDTVYTSYERRVRLIFRIANAKNQNKALGLDDQAEEIKKLGKLSDKELNRLKKKYLG